MKKVCHLVYSYFNELFQCSYCASACTRISVCSCSKRPMIKRTIMDRKSGGRVTKKRMALTKGWFDGVALVGSCICYMNGIHRRFVPWESLYRCLRK